MSSPMKLARQRLRAASDAAVADRRSARPSLPSRSRPAGPKAGAAPAPPAADTIEMRCACGKRYRLPESAAGKRMRCKVCGETTEVPERDRDAEDRESGDGRPEARATDREPAERARSGHRPARAGRSRRDERSDADADSDAGDDRASRRSAPPAGKGLRVAALVLGIVGGLASVLLGLAWIKQYDEAKPLIEMSRGLRDFTASLGGDTSVVDAELAKLERMRKAAYVLLVGLPLGLAGGFLSFRGKTRLAGGILLAAAAAPAVLAPKCLAFTFLLVVGACLSFAAPRGGARP